MGILDRDYMRRREPSTPSRNVVIGIVGVVALIIGAVVIISSGSQRPLRERRTELSRIEQAQSTPFRPINVNTATADDLDAIPYVGAALAEAIIAHRPYATPEDLMAVPGIKERMLERIRSYITFK